MITSFGGWWDTVASSWLPFQKIETGSIYVETASMFNLMPLALLNCMNRSWMFISSEMEEYD